MVLRTGLLVISLVMPVVLVGCGSGFTDENVKEKVFTEEELQRIRDGEKIFGELGMGPPKKGQKPSAKPGGTTARE